MSQSASSALTNAIINELYLTGAYAWRAESTGIMDQAKGIMRTSPKKGVADILACYKGRLVCIEVKVGKDRQSPEQQGFEKNIEHYGGVYYTARDYDQFAEWWERCRLVLDRQTGR